MKFYENQYYHIYNRTINEEALFRKRENYLYFLKKYRYYLDDYFDTIAYCLMPTHFHFFVRVKAKEPSEGFKPSEGYSEGYSMLISRKIGTLLNSYTQAFNKMWDRHGNLFNQKTKAKLIEDENYCITLATYIHQNPIRSKLVEKAYEWEFSSYQDYIDMRKGTLPNKNIILDNINVNDLRSFTERNLIKEK